LRTLARELAKEYWSEPGQIDIYDDAYVALDPVHHPRWAHVMAWVWVELPPAGTKGI
jgi:hypothetical protein